MSSKIQLRRDSAANWTATNPVLAQGEPGLETDTSKVKYGDGSTAWNLLDYASGGAGAGDYTTGFEDGVNENTYHFVTVQGKKEFTFQSQGYKVVEITLTAPMLVNYDADADLEFTATATPVMADIWLQKNTYNNDVFLYKKAEWDANSYTDYLNTLTSPSTGAFTINAGLGSLSVGDKIIIRYWTEGTTYTGSSYDNYGDFIPDVSESTATNTVTINNAEYYNDLGLSSEPSAFTDLLNATYFSKHSISFVQGEINDRRNITAVTDNLDGTLTITFDGTAVQSKTTEAVTFSFTAVDTRANDIYVAVPKTVYPTFIAEVSNNLGSDTNKYCGGTGAARSGYVTINGGSPINFEWFGNDNTAQFLLNLDNTYSYNSGDTIAVTFYKVTTRVNITVYRPTSSNWNNGYKWFDWKDDIETEYSPGRGNGIMAGTGKILMVTFRQPQGNQSQDYRAIPIQFGWSNLGDYQEGPYDYINQNNCADWGYNNDSSYPMYRFNEEGIVFKNTNQFGDQDSVTYKVRIIYKFDLIISGEEDQDWFDC